SRRRHTRFSRDWSSDVCSSDLPSGGSGRPARARAPQATTPGAWRSVPIRNTGSLDDGSAAWGQAVDRACRLDDGTLGRAPYRARTAGQLRVRATETTTPAAGPLASPGATVRVLVAIPDRIAEIDVVLV